uniref:HERV-H LTR-associating 2a, tandem duplicate 2 n=1 Tax=Cyprinus carpio TaxID=7962 RepID=A0A8C2FQE8_CYPCA
MVEERVICQSQNIYPAPEVTWATDPPTDTRSLQNFTRKASDSKGLFTIESKISVIGNISDHTYFCSVASADGMQVWTASLHHQDKLFGEEGSGLLVPCMVTQPCHNFTLTWTFIRTTESIVIFTYDSRTRRIANLWESKAELDIDQAHLGNGSLHLLNPDTLGHSGAYICTFYGFQMRHQVQTHVNITVRVTDDDEHHCRRSWWGTAASVFIFLITVSVALSRCFRLREIPLFERQGQDEPRRNSLESVQTDIHRAPSNTTSFEASKPLKEHPDGSKNDVLPHTPTENSMIYACMIISDSSTPDTPAERHDSRPQTPTGAIITLFTSEINTQVSDDKENERNELDSESHTADGVEMECTVIQRFHNKCETATPELSQINGFR